MYTSGAPPRKGVPAPAEPAAPPGGWTSRLQTQRLFAIRLRLPRSAFWAWPAASSLPGRRSLPRPLSLTRTAHPLPASLPGAALNSVSPRTLSCTNSAAKPRRFWAGSSAATWRRVVPCGPCCARGSSLPSRRPLSPAAMTCGEASLLQQALAACQAATPLGTAQGSTWRCVADRRHGTQH